MRISRSFVASALLSLPLALAPLQSRSEEMKPQPALQKAAMPAPSARKAGQLALSLQNLPIRFEENLGQSASNARFLARGNNYTFLINGDGLALNVLGRRGVSSKGLYIHMLGSNPDKIHGGDKIPALTNYFIGSDPAQWHQSVRNYSSVEHSALYPGINLVYHGSGSQLEYDFVVAPGADPDRIQMQFDGLSPMLHGDDLSFKEDDAVSLKQLHAYQDIDGRKTIVDAHWQIAGNQASIHLGKYDHTRQLVIDPVFFYGAYIGGNANDSVVSIVPAKQAGYYFVALSTNSATITEPGQGPQNPNCPDNCATDTLILGINATNAPAPGTPFPPYSRTPAPVPTLLVESATYIGGNIGVTTPTGMASDAAGNLYVGGTLSGAASVPSKGTQLCTLAPYCSGYLASFSTAIDPVKGAATLALQYSISLPVSPTAVAADGSGNAYVTGSGSTTGAQKLTIPTKDVAFEKQAALGTALTAGTHGFLLELDSTGAEEFASYIGGSGTDQVNAIVVSGTGVYLAGQTSSANFPSTVGKPFGGGTQDAFVVAASNLATSPALTYSTYLGGSDTDVASALAVGAAGNVLVTGSTKSAEFPTQASPSFDAQLWPLTSTQDGGGNAYAAPTSAPTLTPLCSSVPGGVTDAFVTSLSAQGSLVFTDFLGGYSDSTTLGQAVAVDALNVSYIAGSTTATGSGDAACTGDGQTDLFESGALTQDSGLYPHGPNGLSNIFFAQIDPTGQYLLEATLAGSSGSDAASSLLVSAPLATSGIVAIVGNTGNFQSEETDFFNSASFSQVNPTQPPAPQKDSSANQSGFLVEEALAGYCDMKLVSQIGTTLNFSGPCVSGTQSGTLFATASSGTGDPTTLKSSSIAVSQSNGSLVGAATLDLGSLTGSQQISISYGFLPVGAVGGTGQCSIVNNGNDISGCGIGVTGGGGGGTIFNVTSGTLSISLTCTTNCDYLRQANTVLAGQTATVNASIVNGSPDSVSWATVSGPTGKLTNTTDTTASFVAGTQGGTTTISATATVDGKTKQTLKLTTLEVPVFHLAATNTGTPVYGQSVTISVTGTGNYASPSGAFTYQVDDGQAIAGSLSAAGIATLNLPGLSAGSHQVNLAYPGNYVSGGFFAPASASAMFTVNPAVLTVTATSINVEFGKTIPALTYTATGFQFKDTLSSLGGAPNETTTATSNSAPGNYPITISRGSLGSDSVIAEDYSYKFVNGTVTITSPGAAPTPTISPAPGVYTATQSITMSDSLTAAKIYYTLNGANPSAASTLYSGPFTLTASATVQAVAIATGYTSSGVQSNAYTLQAPALSSTSLSFGSVVQNSTSAAQSVTITNAGLNALSRFTLQVGGSNPGDFAQNTGSTCASTLAAQSSCTLAFVFTPSATGARTAAVTISYEGIGSPLTVSLSGTGASPLSIGSAPNQLTAGTTYQFTSNQPVLWSASAGTIDASGLYTAPTSITKNTVVTITATSIANPSLTTSVQLTVVPAPTVTVPSSNTLTAGGSVNIPFSIEAGTGFPGEQYKLACTPASLPTGVSCVFNPNPVTNSAGQNSGTLTISSAALTSQLGTDPRPGSGLPAGTAIATAAGCLLFGIRRRVRRLRQICLLAVMAAVAVLATSGCGTNGSFKTTSSNAYVTGAFTIQVAVTGASPNAGDYNQTVSIFNVQLTIQ